MFENVHSFLKGCLKWQSLENQSDLLGQHKKINFAVE